MSLRKMVRLLCARLGDLVSFRRVPTAWCPDDLGCHVADDLSRTQYMVQTKTLYVSSSSMKCINLSITRHPAFSHCNGL